MKNILLSATALSFALTASALAADLPSKKAPIAPPPPPMTWTGFYVGLNAGGEFGDSNQISVLSAPIYNPTGLNIDIVNRAAFSGSAVLPNTGNGGFSGGGQVGYNFQFGSGALGSGWGGLGGGAFLAGIEADIQGVAGSSSGVTAVNGVVTLNGNPLVTTFNASRSLGYLGTVRGRLGYLVVPTWLIYGTGGLAYGGVSSSAGLLQFRDVNIGSQLIGTAAGAFSDTHTGWTAGGGVEWMFMPNWSAKAEYLHYDLGGVTYSAGFLGGFNFTFLRYGIGPIVSTRFNGNIVRAGVNYHFNWGAPAPVAAKF